MEGWLPACDAGGSSAVGAGRQGGFTRGVWRTGAAGPIMVAMSTSALPISAACFAASQGLKAMIDREMLESVLGRAGYGRVQAAQEETSRPHRGRYRQSIDLRRFAPHDGRPHGAGGSTSFHFAFETIVKAGGNGGTRAAVFDRYVTNPDKVERVSSELHERYLVQAKGGAPEHSPEGRAAFVVSTIGATLEERERFWIKREEGARSAGVEALILRPANGDRDRWRALAEDADTPAAVAEIARRLGRADERDAQTKPIIVEVTDNTVRAWAATLRRRCGDTAANRMVHHRRPRAGRVQTRFVVELPEEFAAADRCAVVQGFADALRPKEAGQCLPLTAVIHVPDLSNDRRNFHCHLNLAPALYGVAGDGSIDHGDKRELRPGELAKMVAPERAAEIDRLRPGERIAEDGRALRRFFAELCNARLEGLGVDRRLDPRSYAEMGIDQEPQEHLSSQAAALVAAGCSVEIDHRNAVRSWTGEDRRRLATLAEEQGIAEAQLGRIDAALVGDISASLRGRLVRVRKEFTALAGDVARDATALGEYDLLAGMARSAAERLRTKTSRSIEAARCATPTTAAAQRELHLIEARHNLASNHLDEITARVEPWQEEIGALRVQLASGRRALATMTTEIDAVLTDVRREVEARWWNDTILSAPRGTVPLRPHDHASKLIEHLQQQGPQEYPPHRFILVDKDSAGMPVPIGFGAHDLALLQKLGVAPRLRAQLEETAGYQVLEIRRLLAAVGAHGLSNVINGQEGGRYLPGFTDDLYKRYCHHPLYRKGETAALIAYDRVQRETARMRVPPADPVTTGPIAVRDDHPAPAIMSVDPPAPPPIQATPTADAVQEQEHRHVHEPTLAAIRAAQRQREFLPQPGAEPPGNLAATPGLAGMPGLPQVDVVPDRAGANLPVPRDPAPDVADPGRNDGADVRRAGAVAAGAGGEPVTPVSGLPPTPRWNSLPTAAELAARRRATPHTDRSRALLRDNKGKGDNGRTLPADRPDPVDEALERLRALSFVPVRERDGRLTIVVERAIEEDADILRKIADVEQDAAIQAQLARARDAMLARLRDPDGPPGGTDDRRYNAAVGAAHKDPEVRSLMLARPSSATGANLAALRTRMRNRLDQGEEAQPVPGNEADDDVLYVAALQKFRSDGNQI